MQNVLLQQTIFDTVTQVNRTHLSKEAVYDGIHRVNYLTLFEQAENLAAGLIEQGIQKGDRIAVCLPNWHEFVVIFLAITKVGAIIIPFNTQYREDEAKYILKNSEARIIFCTKSVNNIDHFDLFREMQNEVSSLKQVITVRYETNSNLSYEQLIKTKTSVKFPHINPAEDPCIILFTSGSTGSPKGATLTHKNVIYSCFTMINALKCSEKDTVLIPVPVFHVFGLIVSVLLTLESGARMVLMEQYKAQKALELIEQEQITIHHGVPTMFILELNHPQFKSYNLSSLRTGIVAAAPCPVEIIRKIRSEMNCNILVSYGLSETSPALTISHWDDNDVLRSETVGRAVPETEVRIVNSKHETLPAGEIGEISARGPGVMKGYFNDLERTKEAIDTDGWFYTGDLGTMDEEGYLRIVGRKKEMIIRGGYNIYPREIEEAFYEHKDVLEVAVVGLPDTVLGEIVCAAILLKEGSKTTALELEHYIKDQLASYKVPSKIICIDKFPMTASGKIQKIELQNQLRKKLVHELK